MRLLEFAQKWTFTSSGSGAWVDAYTSGNVTFTIETAAGSTATVALQYRGQGSSLAVNFESTTVNLDASSVVGRSYTGSYFQVRPYVTAITSTGTVTVYGVGN
jgi:hypothetical protein